MWPEHETTELHLQKLREGDAGEINVLLDHHRGALRRMIQQRLDPAIKARVDASDVVQDVMLEASQRMHEFLEQSKMPFHVWLRHLARDRMIDLHRRHRRSARRSVDREQANQVKGVSDSSVQLLKQLKDAELTPAAAVIRRELQAQFFAAIEQLPEDDREIVLMRHVEQLSNSQVAELLGLSQPAAGMRYLRALKRLRTGLASEFPSRIEPVDSDSPSSPRESHD